MLFPQHTTLMIRRFLKSHLSSDYKQVLQWVFLGFPIPGYGCTTNPIIMSLIPQNRDSWFGLVNKSPFISLVGHHSTDISPFWILFVTEKLMLVCFIILPLDALPFFSKNSVLLLSWKMIFSVTLQSWYFNIYFVQKLTSINSSTQTIHDSVELQLFKFSFVEAGIGKSFPIKIPPP